MSLGTAAIKEEAAASGEKGSLKQQLLGYKEMFSVQAEELQNLVAKIPGVGAAHWVILTPVFVYHFPAAPEIIDSAAV